MIPTALVAARVQGQHFKVDRAAERAGQTPFFKTAKSRSDLRVYRRSRPMKHPPLYHPYSNGARVCLVILLLLWGIHVQLRAVESRGKCW